ncbi:MAG: ATP-binding cassette domain-containing protein [Acetobacter sp.]|nr:ATP-binding cassette domain-containing protein [Bacteroides sp.]MCM1341142.1 ATP-binding cassette domain-containing protein [Acetobacter sp.]MCM1433524.1 ATP-binding cassette domain-containing protein [Clostridiales bacterium]
MLELKNITFSVMENGKEKIIIDDLSYTVEDNKFTVITGPNGGGKSTLAKLIAGIEKPTSGKILYNGKDITDLDITERAKLGISYAFQQPVRFKGIKVIDLIRLAAGERLSAAGACEYLSEVGLCARDYINRDVDGSLSGGELKRIEIAGVLARKTPLSVFDEPEAGIDLWSFKNLIKIFENMQAKKENTIIIISHQERILKIADEILVLSNGKVKSHGSKDDMIDTVLDTAGSGCRLYNE